jgi:hypothetical protein
MIETSVVSCRHFGVDVNAPPTLPRLLRPVRQVTSPVFGPEQKDRRLRRPGDKLQTVVPWLPSKKAGGRR